MDAQQFLAEFGHIANAPGGVERLRELIYQFAVTGRLVPQRSEEGDASQTLERVAQARQRLIREKRFKRTAKLESEKLVRPGIALPESWRWSRLLDLGEINPRNEAKADDAATFVPMAAVSEKHGAPLAGEETRWDEISKGYTHFADGDVLIAKITPCFENGKAARVTGLKHGIGAGSTEFHVFRPITDDVNPAYVYLFLRSPLFRIKGQSSMTGTAGQKRLPTDYFALCALPLPPKDEQSRIVAKVDELMALCDQLEKQQNDRRTLQNALRQSTLQALASAESPQELWEAWERLEANFGRVVGEAGDVKDLRQSILDLAFLGRLSNAQLNDEHVGNLLNRTRAAKAERLATGEMKRRAAAATDVVQLEMELPKHWAKVPLDELFQFIDYRGRTPAKTDNGVVLVTAKNVRPGRLEQDPIEYISENAYEEWMTRGFPRVGDILFTTEAPLGNVALIEVPPKFALAQRVIDLQPFADLNSRCAMYFMMSPIFQDLLDKNSSGMTAKGIKAGKLKQLELPVPPLSEQVRIVERVDRFMHICDDMETQLRDTQRTAGRLAIASVSTLAGIAIEKDEDTALKIPQTELIAQLRLSAPPDVKAQAPLATLLAHHQGEMSARDLWQRYGGEIDAFYAQLKTEVAHGWIAEPEPAQVREKPAAEAAEA